METVASLLSAKASFRTTGDVNFEISSDVLVHILTPEESLPYWREMGSAMGQEINRTISFFQQVRLKNKVIKTTRLYSQTVENSSTERKVVLGHLTGFEFFDDQNINGQRDMRIAFFRVRDLKRVVVPMV